MLVLLAAGSANPFRHESTRFGFSRSMLVELASFPTQHSVPKVRVCITPVPIESIGFTCTVVKVRRVGSGKPTLPGEV
jgi:hypothetical protein